MTYKEPVMAVLVYAKAGETAEETLAALEQLGYEAELSECF